MFACCCFVEIAAEFDLDDSVASSRVGRQRGNMCNDPRCCRAIYTWVLVSEAVTGHKKIAHADRVSEAACYGEMQRLALL